MIKEFPIIFLEFVATSFEDSSRRRETTKPSPVRSGDTACEVSSVNSTCRRTSTMQRPKAFREPDVFGTTGLY